MSAAGPRMMHQVAPYPQILADLVKRLHYREHLGWAVFLEDDLQRDKPGRHAGESRGLTLTVKRCGPDTYNPSRTLQVHHYFPVPPATFGAQSWRRWLFDRLADVDTHERCEDFVLGDERPYAPLHKPGCDPYIVHELSTWAEADTDFRGDRAHPDGNGDGILLGT